MEPPAGDLLEGVAGLSAMGTFRTRRRVELADTDMEGIVHFARYLVYVETAEHQLLAAAGIDLLRDPQGEPWTWPRVKVECEYLAPLRIGDEVEIEVRVAKRGTSSVTYAHTLTCAGRPVARAQVTTVCCRRQPDDTLQPQAIPPSTAQALDAYGG